jgi:hypothetical protein
MPHWLSNRCRAILEQGGRNGRFEDRFTQAGRCRARQRSFSARLVAQVGSTRARHSAGDSAAPFLDAPWAVRRGPRWLVAVIESAERTAGDRSPAARPGRAVRSLRLPGPLIVRRWRPQVCRARLAAHLVTASFIRHPASTWVDASFRLVADNVGDRTLQCASIGLLVHLLLLLASTIECRNFPAHGSNCRHVSSGSAARSASNKAY